MSELFGMDPVGIAHDGEVTKTDLSTSSADQVGLKMVDSAFPLTVTLLDDTDRPFSSNQLRGMEDIVEMERQGTIFIRNGTDLLALAAEARARVTFE